MSTTLSNKRNLFHVETTGTSLKLSGDAIAEIAEIEAELQNGTTTEE